MYCQGVTKELYYYEKINNKSIVNWRITEMNKLMDKNLNISYYLVGKKSKI